MPQSPGIGIFWSRYPYSVRDLILNKRTSKDARLTPRLTIFHMICNVCRHASFHA